MDEETKRRMDKAIEKVVGNFVKKMYEKVWTAFLVGLSSGLLVALVMFLVLKK